MERKFICVICPLGCELTTRMSLEGVLEVQGNACPRGKVYAESECTHPQRTVTSTVKCTDGSLLAVKTDRAIPKEKVMECMEIINRTVAQLPVAIGDTIVEDVFGSRIVATQNRRINYGHENITSRN